jgi:hypothetical protein
VIGMLPAALPALRGCDERWPRFVGSHEVAVALTCGPDRVRRASLPSSIVVVDARTGAERRVVLRLPSDHRITSFSFDASGTHVMWRDAVLTGGGVWGIGGFSLDALRDGAPIQLQSGGGVQPAW